MSNHPGPGSPAPPGSAVESAPLSGVPHRLWRLVALAHHRLLSLDHDGTLAPLETARERAMPSPRSLQLLARISSQSGTTLAILSGRPLAELESRFAGVGAHLVGEYGWEHRLEGGSPALATLPPGTRAALERAAMLVRAEGAGDRLEEKRASLALHTRGMSDDAAETLSRRVESLWCAIARDAALRLTRFAGGVELGAEGHDKGRAIDHLLGLEPPGTLAVHVGDDESDEDAFEAIGERGFGIRVGEPTGPTRASGWLRSQDAVERFLEAWIQAAGRSG